MHEEASHPKAPKHLQKCIVLLRSYAYRKVEFKDTIEPSKQPQSGLLQGCSVSKKGSLMKNANEASGAYPSAGVYQPGKALPALAQRYFKVAIVFLLVGLVVGLHMSMTNNHGATAAHAHINLVGWVTSALFGTYYALHPAKAATKLAAIQFAVYVLGCVVMCPMLYFLVTGNPEVEPAVAGGSLLVFLGVALFAAVVFQKD